MDYKLKKLDVVALLKGSPGKGLLKGQVGTIVEYLAPGVYEVEFCNKMGQAIAILSIQENELLLLHYEEKSA